MAHPSWTVNAVFYYQEGNTALPRLSTIVPSMEGIDSWRCTLSYLDEGGANVIFRLTSLAPRLQGRLLRLRKDLPHVRSTRQQVQEFHEHFKDLIHPHQIVKLQVLELADEVPEIINQNLAERLAHQRPAHRRQDLLPEHEKHGLLVTDMSATHSQHLFFEFKPKWLLQSPNAPDDAKRCRTCALRAMRAAASSEAERKTDSQKYCPLGLVSPDVEERKRQAAQANSEPEIQSYLVSRDAQRLLRTLRDEQQTCDPRGVLSLPPDFSSSGNAGGSEDAKVMGLCKAMTLRDCTLFIRVEHHEDGTWTVEAKVADLDLKSPKSVKKWREIEQKLIEGGWYMGKDDICVLSR
jgi:inositol-pentakisphosphate 2-kinase